jgi:molecular chaperone HscB
MQQMAWREALDDAADLAAVEQIDADVAAQEQSLLSEMSALLDDRGDAVAAAQKVRALMFIGRFREDLRRRLEALDP